jgi:hypothetical protein
MADLASSSAVPEQAIEEVEEMHTHVKNSVHQRLRANSSIMQLKKLLGEFSLHLHLLMSSVLIRAITNSCQSW